MFARTRWMLLFVAVAVAVAAPPAAAKTGHMALDQRARMQRMVIRHDLSTLRWFANHPLRGLTGLRPLRQMVLMRRRERIVLHAAAQLAWTQAELAETQAAIRLRDERRAAARARRKAREARKAKETAQAESLADPITAIRYVFGQYSDQAIAVSRCETGGTFSVWAQNGQYLGLFQMGSWERSRYGNGSTPLEQAQAAYRYFADSGYSWGPWSCKP